MADLTRPNQRRPGRYLGALVCVLLALALAGTFVGGIPGSLPALALGSPLLLHAERAVTLFATLLLALVVLVRAFQGRLPSELSGRGVKYAELEGAEDVRDTTATALGALEVAHLELKARVDALEKAHPDDDEGRASEEG